MAKALYLVIRSQDNWWVDFEGTAHGPFESREAAALEARNLARGQGDERDAEVLVPDGEGRYWVIWSSRHDQNESGGFVPRRIGP